MHTRIPVGYAYAMPQAVLLGQRTAVDNSLHETFYRPSFDAHDLDFVEERSVEQRRPTTDAELPIH